MDKALKMLEMGISTCDGTLLGGVGLFIVDESAGAVVRGKLPITCCTSWIILLRGSINYSEDPLPFIYSIAATVVCTCVQGVVLLVYSTLVHPTD